MSIRILNNDLINKIAAGEVVERPASVVKEVVENSLDAGADFIDVEIKNGGMDLIQISDNGSGMAKEDAKMCVLRHATSKILEVEDLSHISSFGFRGEALAAIASVSKFSLQTKEKKGIAGLMVFQSEIVNENRKIEWKIKDIGCPDGTKIKVENLFFNIPARRKFLKTAQTEFTHILNILTNIALTNYKIRFRLSHNGKIIFNYNSAKK